LKIATLARVVIKIMDSLEKLKDRHEESGRKFPRPTITCPDCQGILILCWGEKRDLYVKHKTHTGCKGGGGEGYLHAFAKQQLREYLDAGNTCTFTHACGEKKVEIASPAGLKWQAEVQLGKSRADIGGLNSNGEMVFCIEIKNTHKTDKVEDRNKIQWVEVEAVEVLGNVDRRDGPTHISLRDISDLKPCCILKTKLLSREKLTRDQCMTFAKKLGYYHDEKTPRAEIVRQVSVRNDRRCVSQRVGWMLIEYEEDEPIPYAIWKDFMKYQQCLHCCKTCETEILKPYCFSCYKKVVRSEVREIYITISKETQNVLRSKLNWLDQVLGESYPDVPCHFCRKVERTQMLAPYISWFGKKKPICYECFDARLEQDGVYNIKLQ